MKFEKNEGKTDRIIRAIAGAISIILGYYINAWFYLLAAILIFTASTGFCLLYKPFNFSTLKKKK